MLLLELTGLGHLVPSVSASSPGPGKHVDYQHGLHAALLPCHLGTAAGSLFSSPLSRSSLLLEASHMNIRMKAKSCICPLRPTLGTLTPFLSQPTLNLVHVSLPPAPPDLHEGFTDLSAFCSSLAAFSFCHPSSPTVLLAGLFS